MTTTAPRTTVTEIVVPAVTPPARPRSPQGSRFLRVLRSTDAKVIGMMYIGFAFFFFMVSGLMALLMRTELARPGMQFLSYEQFNQLFTMHGAIMFLLYATPFVFGLSIMLIPLQIGAPDLAFPRITAAGFWLFLAGGIVASMSFLTPSGAPEFGWTAYPPLSNSVNSPGAGGDLFLMGAVLVVIGTILQAVNILTTILCLRAPGMKMWRMPIYTWNLFFSCIMVLLSYPIIAATFVGLEIDRQFGAHVFDAANGGAILYQHFFWFFAHEEVYLLALAFYGIATEIIPVFSRKPVFGYRGLIVASMAMATMTSAAWAHHLFATGAILLPFFSFMSLMVAIPTGAKFFTWSGIMWRGHVTFETPMLFTIGFMVTFLFGGLTGILVAIPPIDWHVNDSYFVVAHFHYTLFGVMVFTAFAAVYFWFPKFTGRFLDERLGKLHFWLTAIGFHGTFLILHYVGNMGMTRRYPDYQPSDGFTWMNTFSTIFSFVLGASVLVFVWNIIRSIKYGEVTHADDPWGYGNSLEWATATPPPRYNFAAIPRIRSERPAFDLHHPWLASRSEPEGRQRMRPRDWKPIEQREIDEFVAAQAQADVAAFATAGAAAPLPGAGNGSTAPLPGAGNSPYPAGQPNLRPSS